MIKLYYLEVADPLTGFGIRAGFTYNGTRCTSLVTAQNGTLYVRTGSVLQHNLMIHPLTFSQISAAQAFIESPEYSIEFPTPIE